VNQEILDNIAAAKKAESKGTEFKYEERDVILYNLGIGAKKTDLPYVLYVPYFPTFQSSNEAKLTRPCHTVRELKISKHSQHSV
jgi:hypothetical protein